MAAQLGGIGRTSNICLTPVAQCWSQDLGRLSSTADTCLALRASYPFSDVDRVFRLGGRSAPDTRVDLQGFNLVENREGVGATPATARYVLLPVANLLTGYTIKAMQRKIERGDWQEGKVWRRAPDGHIVIDVLGYHRWVEGG